MYANFVYIHNKLIEQQGGLADLNGSEEMIQSLLGSFIGARETLLNKFKKYKKSDSLLNIQKFDAFDGKQNSPLNHWIISPHCNDKI